jgi:oxygen-independent coproporphyrinogen III oxidase
MTQVADALLDKYGRHGPRYTSYPPAPLWHEKIGAQDLAAKIGELGAGTLRGGETRAADFDSDAEIYVHVPFCAQLCTFCGCHTFITKKREPVDLFLETLGQEADAIAKAARRRLRIGGLHFGGGTPTHLSVAQFTKVLDLLEARFDFENCREKSLEVHPHVTTFEQIDFLASRGFDRISLGVQDLTPEVQTAIHRYQTHEETANLVAHARQRGFRSINVDLIFGLPKQTLAGFEKTVDQVVAMGVDRLAVYGYAHVPWLKRHQGAIKESTLPDPKLRRDLYQQAVAGLERAGYRSIGLDHFARPSDELFTAQHDGTLTRTFMGYTVRHAPALLGLGPSAIGEVGHLYAQNESDLKPWADAIAARGLATKRGFLLSEEDDLRRAVIRAVLCHLRVDARAIGAAFGIEFKSHFAAELLRLQEMAADRLVEIAADGSLALTETGRYLSRNVAMVFDQYLEGPPQPAPDDVEGGGTQSGKPVPLTKSSPRYSRTV